MQFSGKPTTNDFAVISITKVQEETDADGSCHAFDSSEHGQKLMHPALTSYTYKCIVDQQP